MALQTLSTSFPDSVYTASAKPSVATLKADISAIETAVNDHAANAVDLTATQALTNKTLTAPVLTSPVINTGISGTAIVDEDNLVSDSATKVPTQQSVKAYVDATAAANAPVGEIRMFGGAVAPTGFLLCDGSSLLRAGTYASLFAVVGTTFGSADGTHFTLPDMRGVFPKGAGTTDRTLGKDANGGFFAGILGTYLTDKIQGHWHQIASRPTSVGGATQGIQGGMDNPDTNYEPAKAMITNGVNGTPRVGDTTEPQSLGLSFIIKY
jgi:microcystin-dependent protein